MALAWAPAHQLRRERTGFGRTLLYPVELRGYTYEQPRPPAKKLRGCFDFRVFVALPTMQRGAGTSAHSAWEKVAYERFFARRRPSPWNYVDRLQQACAQPAPDRGPRLPLAIISDQAATLGRGVEPLLDVALLELASRDPSTQRPCGMIQCCVSPAWCHRGDVVQDLAHVRFR